MVDKIFGADFADDTFPNGNSTISINTGTALEDVTLFNILKIISLLSEDTAPVGGDSIFTWDASATDVKQVGLSNLHKALTQATTSQAGTVELATTTEAQAGTDTARAVTPEGLKTAMQNGWSELSESWSYASATTITVPTDATTRFRVGDKIRLKQGGGYKYFYIYVVAATLLTVTGGTDYTVANSAITDIAISRDSEPLGFPAAFNWTPTWGNLTTTSGTQVAKFSIQGNWCEFTVEFNFGASSAITGAVTHSLPVPCATQTSTFLAIGSVVMHDFATAIYYGATVIQSGSVTIRAITASGTYAFWATISSTIPFTWANTDQLVVTGRYRIP